MHQTGVAHPDADDAEEELSRLLALAGRIALVLFALCLVLVGTWYVGSAADLSEPGLLFLVNLLSLTSSVLVAWAFATFAARLAAALALRLRTGVVAWMAPPIFFFFGGASLLFAELVKHFISWSG